MRISDWSSDVCSSDLAAGEILAAHAHAQLGMPMSRNLGPSVAAERFMAQADAVEARLVQHAAARRGCERVMVAGAPFPLEPCGQIGRASCRARVCQYV